MTDYEKVCWNCGSKKVTPVQTWFRCVDCGATHVPHGDPGIPAITEVDMKTGGSSRPGRDTYFRPSAQSQKAAAKAREAAREKEKANAGSKD